MALNEAVFTIEEVGEHFRVSVQAIREEIESGRLRALNIGGFIRIRESDLNEYKTSAYTKTGTNKKATAKSLDPKLTPAQNFTHTWPDSKVEQFTGARQGIVPYRGREYHVKIGFTVRNAAGRPRRRCLVLVDRYATVEFVAANEEVVGKMASILKDRHGKQLPVGAAVPPEYDGIPVGPYRGVVLGPGASNGLAVICEQTDFDIMVTHALIRHQYRHERN